MSCLCPVKQASLEIRNCEKEILKVFTAKLINAVSERINSMIKDAKKP